MKEGTHMTKTEIFEFLSGCPCFYLATCDAGEPRVRAIMLYRADENGIIFHTGPFKEVYRQIGQNAHVQLCFHDMAKGLQVRVRGALENVSAQALKEEIANHPSRGFMQAWKANCKSEEEFYGMFDVFRLKNGIANVWTFQTNFAPKEDIML